MAVTISSPFRVVVHAARPAGVGPVKLGDMSYDDPSWNVISENLLTPWKNPGGDWIDANGAQQGRAPFASATLPQFAPNGAVLTFDCASLVAQLVQRGNGGIMVRMSSGGNCYATSRQTTTAPSLVPRMTVVTSSGTINCRCVADTWITSQGGHLFGEDPQMQCNQNNPMLLRFDLSGVTGAVQSATMSLNVEVGGPLTLNLYLLDMPLYSSSPGIDLQANVVQGIASRVSQDSALAGRSDLGVLIYPSMASDQAIRNYFGVAGEGFCNNSPGDFEIVSWPEFGLSAARVKGDTPTGPSIVTMGKLVTPSQNGPIIAPWQRALGNGYDELWFRYLMMVERDAFANMNPSNVGGKLPGMEGTYDFTFGANNPFAAATKWDARLGHGRLNQTNDLFEFHWHYYGADHSIPDFPANALALLANVKTIFLKPGQKYCIEEHIKLNTPDGGGGWNSDGICEVWVDGVLMTRYTDKKIRSDSRCQIATAPFVNFYQGGTVAPLGPIHYQFSGMCVATQYIGPPKKIA